MFKKLALFIVLIVLGYFSFNYYYVQYLNTDEVVNIKGDASNYKFKPIDTDGKNFNGDSLKVYEITREKLLPKEDDNKINNKNEDLPVSNEKDTKVINDKEIQNNKLYLQLGSYTTKEKAKSFIKEFKEKNTAININKNLNFIIVKANLGSRGTYYRIRLGPYNINNEVLSLCLELKLVNNECLIVKDK